MWCRGIFSECAQLTRSNKLMIQPNGMGRPAIESESLLGDVLLASEAIPSSAGHEEPCANQPGPPGKAKHPTPPIAHSTVRER